MKRLNIKTRLLWLRFIRLLFGVFGYSVSTEWQVDIKHYDGCWNEWTTGMPDEESAVASMEKSKSQNTDREFRVTYNITATKTRD